MSKTIDQYALAGALQNGDKFLFERGGQYFSVLAQSLLSGAVIEDTYANVNSDRTGESLEAGATYYITDKYVYVTAVTNGQIALDGILFARNADYNGAGAYGGITTSNGFAVNATGTNLGVWNSALTPAAGDVAIYNNLHWLNKTGAVGTAPSGDAVNWEAVPNTDITVADTYGYIYEFDAVEYDFINDTTRRRVDGRGNQVHEAGIATWRWGDDNVTNNIAMQGTDFPIYNTYGTITDNIITGRFATITIPTGSTLTACIFEFPSFSNAAEYLDRDTSGGITVRNCHFSGAPDGTISIVPLGSELAGKTLVAQIASSFEATVPLVTTAWGAGVTYNFGDFATDGTATYMYINATAASGNLTSDNAYWQEIYDFTTAGRYKLTIPVYLEMYGVLNLTSTNAAETIDEIVWSSSYLCAPMLKPASGLTVTLVNTAYASLANAGEYLSNGNNAINGSLAQWAMVERTELIGGTRYSRKYLLRNDVV